MKYAELIRENRRLWQASPRGAKSDYDQSYLLYYVYRPLSFSISPFFYRLGISANQMSVAGWLLVFVGCYYYSLGTDVGLKVGAVVLFFHFLGDLVDGNLARLHNHRTYLGNYYDAIGDALRMPFFYLGLTLGSLDMLEALEGHQLQLLVAIPPILSLLDIYFFQRLERIYSQIQVDKSLNIKSDLAKQTAIQGGGSIIKVFLKFVRRIYHEIEMPIWILLSFLGHPGPLIYFSAFGISSLALLNIAGTIYRAKKTINIRK